MRRSLIISVLLCITLTAGAQIVPEWSRNVGGSYIDVLMSSCRGSDGKLMFLGFSESSDHDLKENAGDYDAWIYILDSAGQLFWSKSVGGSSTEYAMKILQRPDSLSLILINSLSSGSPYFPTNYGNMDVWVKGLTPDTLITTGIHLPGSDADYGNDLALTLNGGFVMVGSTRSSDTIFGSNHGSTDGFAARFGPTGQFVWLYCYGTPLHESFQRIVAGPGGNFYALGHADNASDQQDVWLVNLSSTGTVSGETRLIGDSTNMEMSLRLVHDTVLYAGGCTFSASGDFSDNPARGSAFLARLDPLLNVDTVVYLSGNGIQAITAIEPFCDSLLIISVVSTSTDALFSGNYGGSDLYFFVLDKNLEIVGGTRFGGSADDAVMEGPVTCMLLQSPHRLVAASATFSGDHDLPANYGSLDGWVLSFDPSEMVSDIAENNTGVRLLDFYPNPAAESIIVVSSMQSAECTLYDISGKPVQTFDLRGQINRLCLKGIPDGLYFIELNSSEGRAVSKILIAR